MCDEVLYEILGVKSDACLKTIQKAYRINAKEFHPDKCKKDDMTMRELNYSYQVLTDTKVYELSYINEYDEIEIFMATRKEIYDSEGLRALEFFSQNSTSMQEEITEKGTIEMVLVEGFPYMEIKLSQKYCSLSKNDLSDDFLYHSFPPSKMKPLSQNIISLQLSSSIEKLVEEIPVPEEIEQTDEFLEDIPYKPPPDKCDFPKCNHRPSRPRDLKRHYNVVHLKIRSFKCDFINCEKKYTSNQSLKDHKNSHTGNKPYKCKVKNCEKSFASSKSLRFHSGKHLKNRRK